MENTVKQTKKRTPIIIIVAIALLILYLLTTIFSSFINEKYNIVIMGVESTRTDVLMLAQVDTKNDTIKFLSIPRDTYYPVEGYNGLGQKKINAVYGFKKGGNIDGVLSAVSGITGLNTNYYVLVDYQAVESIVDSIGGIDLEVPFDMYYDDPYSNPPLHINLKAGPQHLSGKQALDFIRFRQNNDGTHSEGDVARVERQKTVLKAILDKASGPLLPFYGVNAFSNLKTNIDFVNILKISLGIIGIDQEKIETFSLPASYVGYGDDGLSYYFHDPNLTKELIDTHFR